MSRLDALIKEYCPNGVEYDELGNLGKFYGGVSGKSKDDFMSGNCKFISYMNVFSNPSLNIYTEEKVNIEENEKQNTILYGDIIFTGSSENKDECGMSSVLTHQTDEKLYLNSFCFGFRLYDKNLLLPDFSKHLFRSLELRKQINKTASGVTRFNVSKRKMEKVIIPLPPVPVQAEIVRILDNFTELTAVLTAELTARKEQYEYYETQILFNNNNKIVPLGKLCTVNQGLQVPISQRKTEKGHNRYFYITVQFLKDNDDKFYIENPSLNVICDIDDILVTRTGSTGKIITGIKGCFHNNFFKVNCFDDVDKRYMYYVLKSNKIYEKLLYAASGGTVPDLPHNKFYKIEVPIPEKIEEQQRIVDILDRFETLCNDISKGLPAEIKAREEQYEYYRNKLLTFKEKEA